MDPRRDLAVEVGSLGGEARSTHLVPFRCFGEFRLDFRANDQPRLHAPPVAVSTPACPARNPALPCLPVHRGPSDPHDLMEGGFPTMATCVAFRPGHQREERGRAAFTLAVLLLVASACQDAGPAGGDGDLQVQDSAGVEIVRDARTERPLGITEVLRVGVVEGDPAYQFDRIRTVTVEPGGAFWVVDGHPALRRYDAEGRHVAEAGGQGEGPGEAETYLAAVAISDGVVAFGIPQWFQWFGPDGTFRDSRRAATEDGGMLQLLGRAGERLVFHRTRVPPGSSGHNMETGGAPHVRTTTELYTAPGMLENLRTVASFPGRLLTGQGAAGPFVLGRTSLAVDDAGRIYVSDTLAYRVQVHDLEGHLIRVIERPLPPVPIAEGFADQVRQGVEAAFREGIPGIIEPGLDAQRREQVERISMAAVPPRPPPHFPFIDRVMVSPEGTLWVERADRHPRPALRAVAHAFGYVHYAWHPSWRSPQVFDVFDREGRYSGTVELAFGFTPMEASGNRIYGTLTDELGVEQVVAFQIEGL
jgi:hypothetical protein